MSTDNSRITVAQMARVYLAPVGTLAPDGPLAVLVPAWREVGLFTPDSLSFATDPAFEEVRSHQSNYPTRRFQTTDAASLEVDLQEWSAANFAAVFGGGTVVSLTPTVAPTTPYYKFSPPAIGGRTQVAAMVEIVDGTKKYRRVIPKAEQSAGVTQAMSKTAPGTLALRLSVIGSDVGDPWYDMTNDPAFASLTA